MQGLIRRIEELGPLETEIVSRVTTARVAFADYDLIKSDFIHLAPLDNKAVDEWLVANFAFISNAQLPQTIVNSEIKTGYEYTLAFRPRMYGRAAIFSLRSNQRWLGSEGHASGCIDVKGLGVAPRRTPAQRTHGHGLFLLSMALQEVIAERMIRRVFSHAGEPIATVQNYAVIDLGCDLLYPTRKPAGLLVRRTYARDPDLKTAGSVEDRLEPRVELSLRRYGISSRMKLPWISVSSTPEKGLSTVYGMPPEPMTASQFAQFVEATRFVAGDLAIDGLNLQFTSGVSIDPPAGRLIDFGGFGIYAKFDNAMATLVSDKPLFLGQILFPTDARFIQPDPAIRVRIDMPYLEAECHAVAYEFRQGAISSEEVAERLTAVVENGTAHLLR